MPSSNSQRLRKELELAAESIPDEPAGYRAKLVEVALQCISYSGEHVDRRTNINQRFDSRIEEIAAFIRQESEE